MIAMNAPVPMFFSGLQDHFFAAHVVLICLGWSVYVKQSSSAPIDAQIKEGSKLQKVHRIRLHQEGQQFFMDNWRGKVLREPLVYFHTSSLHQRIAPAFAEHQLGSQLEVLRV